MRLHLEYDLSFGTLDYYTV